MSNKVTVKLSSDTSELNSGLNRAQSKIRQFANESRGSFGGVGRALRGELSGAVGRFLPAAGLVGAGLAAGKAVADSIQAAMEAESIKVRFEVLVGDPQKANDLIRKLRDLSARTPLKFNDVAEAGQKLVAFGEDAAYVPEVLRRIGDVSSGVGAGIAEIAEIYGKARVQGTLFAEDINQLTGRGIPVIQEFARILGVSEGEVKKLASQGLITFPALAAAMQSLTNEGGKFAGMMEKLSSTTGGKLSTLSDEWTMLKAEVGKGINELVVNPLSGGIAQGIHALRQFAGTAKEGKPQDQANGPTQAELEEQARAGIREAEQAAAAKDAAEKAAWEEKRMERAKASLAGLQDQRRAMAREDIKLLPDADQMAGFNAALDDVFQRMQKQGGAFFEPSLKGLREWADKAAEIAAKTGNTTGAEAAVKLLGEARDLMGQMDTLSSKLRAKAVSDSEQKVKAGKDAEKDQEEGKKLETARAEFKLESQITAELSASAGLETDKVKALQDQLSVLQQTQQIRDQLGLSEADAVKMAEARVKLEREATKAAEDGARAKKLQETMQQAAVNHERASGRNRRADRMERDMEVARQQKELQELGMSPEEAAKRAEAMQRDADKIAGKRTVIRGHTNSQGAVRGFEGLDGRSFPGLDAMHQQRGTSLRADWQFPGLDGLARSQVRANTQRAEEAKQGSGAENLLKTMTGLLEKIEQKLEIAA